MGLTWVVTYTGCMECVMANVNMKIKVPALGERPDDHLEDWLAYYSETEVVEILNRYCDIKDRETKYRKGAAETAKRVKEYLEAQGVDISKL